MSAPHSPGGVSIVSASRSVATHSFAFASWACARTYCVSMLPTATQKDSLASNGQSMTCMRMACRQWLGQWKTDVHKAHQVSALAGGQLAYRRHLVSEGPVVTDSAVGSRILHQRAAHVAAKLHSGLVYDVNAQAEAVGAALAHRDRLRVAQAAHQEARLLAAAPGRCTAQSAS